MEKHLVIQDLNLSPAGEWQPDDCGWTVLRVVAGVGYALAENHVCELNADDVLIAGPGSKAVLRASQLGALRLEFFLVLPQCLNGVLTIMESKLLEKPLTSAGAALLHHPGREAVAQKLKRIAAQRQRDSLPLRSALLQFWAAAINSFLPPPETATGGSLQLRDRFRELVARLPVSELACASLPELAEKLHCSERHFSRLFREEFKVSLRVWQTSQRLQRASQLLTVSDTKIANVAKEAGYRHLGLFNAMFKRQFGMTPSAWRQKAGLAVAVYFLHLPGLMADAAELVMVCS